MSDRVSGQLVQPNIVNPTGAVLKLGVGRVCMLSVSAAGAQGTINDCATVGAAAVGNQIAVIPAAVGNYLIDMPFIVGGVVVPGAAQVCSVSYV